MNSPNWFYTWWAIYLVCNGIFPYAVLTIGGMVIYDGILCKKEYSKIPIITLKITGAVVFTLYIAGSALWAVYNFVR